MSGFDRGGRGRGGYRRDDRDGDRSSGDRHYGDRSRERSNMGDDRQYGRGDRGGRGFRGGGSFRGGRGGGSGPAPDVRLSNNNMFENLDPKELELTDNVEIAGCGDRYGNQGTGIQLSSNYFRVNSLPNCMIQQYSVTFEPEIESMKLRQGLLRSQKEFVHTVFAFDGSILFMPKLIQNLSLSAQTKQGNEITINIKHTGSVAPGSPTSTVIFNIITRRVMSLLAMKLVKRHHFDPTDAKIIKEHGLEIWPGISGNLNFFDNTPLYCVDTLSHVMRRESAYEFIKNLADNNEMNKDDIERKLVGQVVMTRYNNRTYRIDSVDWNKTPQSKFSLKDGSEISYIEYYKKHYDINISDPHQPLLASVMKERRSKHEKRQAEQRGESTKPVEQIVHLIPELSYLTGISDDVRSNFAIMKDLAVYTKLSPSARCNGVYNFLDRISKCQAASEYLNSWGVEFDRHLISLPARQLPVEKIYLRDEKESFVSDAEQVDWTNAFRQGRMMNPGSIRDWVVFVSQRDRSIAENFLGMLEQACNSLDFPVQYPQIVEVRNANSNEFIKQMRTTLGSGSKYQLAMFVIPPNRKEIYDAIKVSSCVENPIPTQVMLTKTLTRQNALRSVATKVAIQMSVKRGGEPWMVAIPTKKKMIVGIDVCHDTGSSRNSWLGFVASLNDNFTRYYSRATRQPARTEIADSLCANMKIALQQYNKLNKSLPDSIIVYRDGVGDGQIEVVRTHELPSLQKAVEEACPENTPSIAFIIVRKRISTRLFRGGDIHASNPIPGSIVDRVITKENRPNFYLVSQCVREGTVNPTHYIVLSNDTKLKTSHLQRLTYKTCHLYFNWMGTVRVPAPCQYAHKLCFIVSQSIKKEPSNALSNTLFYL